MWQDYYSVTSLADACDILAERGARARIIAGGTDLLLEIERGVRTGIDTLIDISRVPELDRIVLDEQEYIHLGPLVTHNHCVAAKLIVERALPLAQAAWEVGAPQIRNRGTVAGNLVTASPANDTITPLMALGARLRLRSRSAERVVPLSEFFTGVRKTVLRPDEMLVDIFFPAMRYNQRGMFLKLALRRAQAISVVNLAVVVTFKNGELVPAPHGGGVLALPETPVVHGKPITQAQITLGAVAPTIIHARAAEAHLVGRQLTEETTAEAARLAQQVAHPIDDLRGSADYRSELVRVGVQRCLRSLAHGVERANFPDQPILLWGKDHREAPRLENSLHHTAESPIRTSINGKMYTFPGGHTRTLLRLLREAAGLIGTKEGCAEGECGACTVFMDGMAVMSCLVPAARAHGAEIVTVEGLAKDGQLHPVQRAFIDEGAVQCGYCTPGFLMTAAKLLEEQPQPTRSQIQQALTGNLCRCTGYYKIVGAIERAAQETSSPEQLAGVVESRQNMEVE
jgi:xanthine dehydrogenase iron-sulfur cluster and FAD-binding subunit A